MRLSGWDANVLLDAWPALMKHAASAASFFRQEIHRMVHEVWSHYFPLRETHDLAFFLGVLLCEIECYGDALPFFHESTAVYGPNPTTVSTSASACTTWVTSKRPASRWIRPSKGRPDFEPALELSKEIAAALKKKRPKERKRPKGRTSP